MSSELSLTPAALLHQLGGVSPSTLHSTRRLVFHLITDVVALVKLATRVRAGLQCADVSALFGWLVVAFSPAAPPPFFPSLSAAWAVLLLCCKLYVEVLMASHEFENSVNGSSCR